MDRKMLLCAQCKAAVPVEASLRPASFPFCSVRCKMADLGKWFGEEYVVPAPIAPDDYEAIETVIQAQRGEG